MSTLYLPIENLDSLALSSSRCNEQNEDIKPSFTISFVNKMDDAMQSLNLEELKEETETEIKPSFTISFENKMNDAMKSLDLEDERDVIIHNEEILINSRDTELIKKVFKLLSDNGIKIKEIINNTLQQVLRNEHINISL